MASFPKMQLTAKGIALLTKVQDGTQLKYTKVKIGSGKLDGEPISPLTDLIVVNAVMMDLTGEKVGNNTFKIGSYFDNKTITKGFIWREIGIFALDPQEGEILYAYSNAGDAGDYIPVATDKRIEKYLYTYVSISSAENVTVETQGSEMFITKPVFDTSLINKVDKEKGKGLSTNDYTNEDKEKLATLNNYDDSGLRQEISTKVDKNTVYTKQETDSKLTEQQTYTDTQLSEKTGINATATYTNNIVTITAPVSAQQITFIAPSDFIENDTYTLNGTQITITDLNNEPLSNAWKQGSPVQLILKGNKAFFKSGGGASFPKSWQDRQIGEATEYIQKDSPIQYKTIGGVDNLLQLQIPYQLNNSDLYGRSIATSDKYVAIAFSIELHIYEKDTNGTTLNFVKKYTREELSISSFYQCAYISNKLIVLVDKSPYMLMYDNYGLGNKMAALDVPLPLSFYKLTSNGTDTVVVFSGSSTNTGMFVYKYHNNALRLLENTSPYLCQAATITTTYTNGSPDIVAMQKEVAIHI